MVEVSDDEMPLSVAFIRVFSVLMLLLGTAEFIISGIQMDASSSLDIGGIYFAVTSFCSGMWGLCMVEGVQQFNMLTLFLFSNIVCSLVAVIISSITQDVVDRIEACAEFDASGQREPRCTDQETGSYSNFTCMGNEAYYLDAAKCAARFIDSGASTAHDCSCVYVEGGTHCREFAGYSDCSDVQDMLPALSLGTYVLAYMCMGLSVFLLFCSCYAACTHTKRRGLMSVTAHELGAAPQVRWVEGWGSGQHTLRAMRSFRVQPISADREGQGGIVQMGRPFASPVRAVAVAPSPDSRAATRAASPTSARRP